jgi:hypothetical protein
MSLSGKWFGRFSRTGDSVRPLRSDSPSLGSNPPAPARQSLNLGLSADTSDKCPPTAAFCELSLRLYVPKLDNLSAKSPIVSSPHMKYSRFWETRAGDRARSALRGVGRSLIQPFKETKPGSVTSSAAETLLLAAKPGCRLFVPFSLRSFGP